MPEHDADEITRLAEFGGRFAAPGGSMASAADARRRGDAIRRRRQAWVTGVAAVTLAAVTVPALSLSSKDRISDPVGPAGTPSAASSPLSETDLIDDSTAQYLERGDWATATTFSGDGQDLFHSCQPEPFSALGARASYTRRFDFRDADPALGPGPSLVASVMEFDDTAAARRGYQSISGWLTGCATQLEPEFGKVNVLPTGRDVVVPGGAEATIYDAHWGPVPADIDPLGYDSYISETGVLLREDRVAILSILTVGQDYNWPEEDGGTPVERMLPDAAELLGPG